MSVTVYETPNCQQCSATKRQLKLRDIPFTQVNLADDPAAYQMVTTELGYNQAPVVVVENNGEMTHWSGFRPDLLKKAFGL